ncbi:2-dehydro-3-deoxyphosphogluconate aldolase [Oceanobacillus iheyensis HTE831]|uniref:2-dehydro-3-deoxyphosphogluconate aldolase n=1 Tax=Oceanobacillus iheyensis (strain DSM 14371 / CIP 107618 / JCM 11309 / KCTC 3954 / HTE831) TaxID=221109 RepID=Q8EP99_OCEIH|nr:bifunctional 4-hydroxy-2-oxoglutarate aldolase/2-dehydro-3-deoxy-phosphogluconate aldolase [Oceanobacillus iheyensis]BAC14170.1 2-dehydro-3-deoxyphosphogluconate aldolase [Oceanobacillus iheyensis HTE831]
MDILKQVEKEKLIAIIRGYDTKETIKIAKALYEGGIRLLEVTLNSDNALQTIGALHSELENDVVIGAGTVLDSESAVLAIKAGAKFIISPTLDIETIKATKRYGVISIPAAFTPTEILSAQEAGADIVKLFPASSLGPNYVKDVHGPLPHIKLLPTGGVNVENVTEFIQKGAVGVGLGSSLVPNTVNVTDEFLEQVTNNAKQFTSKMKTL